MPSPTGLSIITSVQIGGSAHLAAGEKRLRRGRACRCSRCSGCLSVMGVW